MQKLMNSQELMNQAIDMLNKGGNAPMSEISAYSGMSIAYSLIAIAQELIKLNRESNHEENWIRKEQDPKLKERGLDY